MTGASESPRSLLRRLFGSRLRVSMVLAVGAVLSAAAWSFELEQSGRFADFSHEQAVLATVIGMDFEHRLADLQSANGTRDEATLPDDVVLDLISGARRLEDRGELMVLVSRPGQQGFLTTDRRVISSRRLREALDGTESTVMLPRHEAVTFGLPRRRAVAGLARVGAHPHGPWGVVVLASANRLRTHERHEQWRLGLTVGIVTVVVVVIGALARRRERRQLELEREIAVSALEREREAALAKADKMAALAALSTGIAHELGTPLSIIMERVDQVMARVKGDERSEQVLRIVTEQVERIQRIVRASLALARGDSPSLVEAAPASLAQRAVTLVRHRFDKAGVILDCAIDDGLPTIRCEPSLFEQALVNLLLNACDASARGKRVVLTVHADDGGVRFVVEDEGEGIPHDLIEKATEPFFSTKRGVGGSGLGLTIAREIVDHHGGALLLERRTDTAGTRAVIVIKS